MQARGYFSAYERLIPLAKVTLLGYIFNKMRLIFFRRGRGDEPVRNYFDSLSPSEQETIEALLTELAQKGYLPFPFARKLKGVEKLWELRPGRHRVIYFYYQGDKAVLLHAFKKQSQKTPDKEIHVALQRMKMTEIGGV